MSDTPAFVTVTLNPALDVTLEVDRLAPGEVHRVIRHHRQAGGKGLNVATLLAHAGHPGVVATGFLGADNDDAFRRHCSDHGLVDAFVRLPGATRTCIKIVETGSRRTTDLNPPGLSPDPAAVDELRRRLIRRLRPGDWAVVSGSLPPGLAPETFAALLADLRATGSRVAVDTSGPALAAAVAAGVDLIKPNAAELAELVGHPLPDPAAVLAAARGLTGHPLDPTGAKPAGHPLPGPTAELAAARGQQAPRLIVSLGADGAFFLGPDHALHAKLPPLAIATTVGAGDALLAGALHAIATGHPPEPTARLASVFAWSRLESLEPHLPSPEEREARGGQVEVRTV